MKKLGILISILFITLPFKVNALTGSASIYCNNSKLVPGGTTTCTLSITSDGEVSSVHGVIGVGSGLSLGSVSKASIWEGSAEGGIIDVYTDNNKSGSFSVATFSISASSSITTGANVLVTVSGLELGDKGFQANYISDTSASIRIPSTVNTLSSLTVSNGSLAFNPNTTNYNVTVDSSVSSITIGATKTDGNSSVSGTGTKTLNYGSNIFNITVTSESGASRTYTINITRKQPPKTDNNQNTGTTNKPSSSGSSSNNGTTSGGSGASSNNNATTKSTEEKKKSNNNYLSSLEVNGKKIALSKEITTYELTVENDVEELKIDYKADDSKASIKLDGDKKLKVGENTFKIVVKAEDGSERTYTLKVKRAEKGKEVSKNNYLKSLKITGYDITFNKKTLEYTIEIKDEEMLNIKAIAEDSKAKVRILDNNNLKDGSKVKILVTAEDGSSREYIINITVKKSLLLPIIISILTIAVITLFVVIIIRRKKNNKRK